MDYRQAKGIRKSSFGSLLAEQEGGLGSSLGKAISLKTKANITGIKETFDPLSIAKFLTLGSDWAPAMLGKMTGRSKKDVGYFSGNKRAQQVGGGDTATKVGSLKESNEMLDILMKIYTFMQKTIDEEKKRREEENNYKEIKDDDKKKRHDALLAAIKGMSGGEKEQKTAEKVQEDTGMGLGGIIGSILDSFGGAKIALQMLGTLGPLLINPITLGLLAAVAVGGLAAYLWKNSDPEKVKETLAGGGTSMSAGLGSEGQLPSVSEEQANKSLEEKAAAVDKKGLKKATVQELEAKKQLLVEYGKAKSPEVAELTKEIQLRKTSVESTPTETKVTTTQTNSAAPAPATPAATPAETTNPGQKLNAVQAQNNDLSIPESKPDPASLVSNTVNTNQGKGQNKFPIPSVRNSEQTFQRMILNSTRVV